MPPVWLIGALCLGWLGSEIGPRLGGWASIAGPILVIAGLALMGLSFIEFRRARTTVIPHENPSALISTGIFRYSRNPIYLGDTMILAGCVLYWHSLLGLALVPAFAFVLKKRFIEPEERRLEEAFPTEFDAYRAATRRWL